RDVVDVKAVKRSPAKKATSKKRDAKKGKKKENAGGAAGRGGARRPTVTAGRRPSPVSFSDLDFEEIRSQGTLQAARAAGLDLDLMTIDEIPDALRVQNAGLATALDRFLDALRDWHEFHKRAASRAWTAEDGQRLARLVR